MENKYLIDKTIRFIQENPKDNLSLRSIADNAGFSLTYFDAIFRKHTGYSPVEYSRIYKLTRSALELRRTEKKVIDISFDYGYETAESFSRAFKKFYGINPVEYRKKYSGEAVTWHDLSGKIAISHFMRYFPELNISDVDLALDYCFMHNMAKYAEDIVGITVADTVILTLGDPENLKHFIYVSDYNSTEPSVTIIADDEADAVEYVKLLSKLNNQSFSIRRPADTEWDVFDSEVEKRGLTCKCGYDMLYPSKEIAVPDCDVMTVRELTDADMTHIKMFKESGGCADCHVRAIKIHFDGKGNAGMRPVGVFDNDVLITLAMPMLDHVRELKKYDIGAIFTIDNVKEDKAVEVIWKYVINMCLEDGAIIGNSNSHEDDSPLGVDTCERIGLVKVAENRGYSKK